MNLIKMFTSLFIDDKYKSHPEAVIISCYFNPTGNPYRLKAFNAFYNTIKHTNHRIVECVIGDSKPELPITDSISRIYTKDTLWHKETLLNNIIKTLPKEFKYVFWVDADVLFTNKKWIIDGVKELKTSNIIQPFEYCVHLNQDETKPSFDLEKEKKTTFSPELRHPMVWRSFSANHKTGISGDENYDKHGHVGFAWGARREVLDAVPLYDRALIGGADHIIAHAAAGHFNHKCIIKSFTEDIDAVMDWSYIFHNVVDGKIGYVAGDLYHIWHGDLKKRQYLKRIQEFTPISKDIKKRDENGLYVTEDDSYVKNYMENRENTGSTETTGTLEFMEKFEKTVKLPKKPIKVQTAGVYGTTNKLTKKLHESAKKKGFARPSETNDELRRRLVRENPNADSSFIDSLLLGYLTDSTFDGTIMGGNLLGAMIGDALNDSATPDAGFQDGFGGGGFSGGGAGADWTQPDDSTSTTQETNNDYSNDNFS
jgi:hypothetical protein